MTIQTACAALRAAADVYAIARILGRMADDGDGMTVELPADLAGREDVNLGANIADVTVRILH